MASDDQSEAIDTSEGINNSSLLSESSDDVDEPKLSYERILNDLSNFIRTDTITSSCLHIKFLAIGTLSGRIYVFDHEGNKVKELCAPPPKTVHCISIDEKGEYLVSCSDDKLAVYGLFNDDHDEFIPLDKPTHVVAINPHFHRAGHHRRFVAGDDKVVLYEPKILGLGGKYKPTTVLQSKEQRVKTLSWNGQFIAWATDVAVQIYDNEQKAIITRIKRDSEFENPSVPEPCRFCWKDKRTLLIGWTNTVKVCIIKERSHEVLNDSQLKSLPRKYVEIVSMFETDFTICGLAPFNNSMFTLSMHNPTKTRVRRISRDTQYSCNSSLTSVQLSNTSTITEISPSDSNSSQSSQTTLIRPQVHILETFSNSYNELSKDILTPNGCLNLKTKNEHDRRLRNFPYNLLSLHKEGIYFIVCPKDVLSAKPRDYDDHIDWLIDHSKLEECCKFAREFTDELNRHTLKEVEELYMKELLKGGTPESYGEAAKLCVSICGHDRESWDHVIQTFCDLNQLKHLLPYLPRNLKGFHLDRKSFDFILNDCLNRDSVSFFRAITKIPCQLYSLEAMTDQVVRGLANDPENKILNGALAELYTQMGKFEEAVNIYLDYNDTTKIFSLIRNNNLVSILRDKVDRLMQIDADETSQLLVENIEFIPMKDVVNRLESYKSRHYLVSYLHRLFVKDPDSCTEYHDLMVKLYASHKRESLLNFLKLSTDYRLDEALRICEEANLIEELVFLYEKMGNVRTALEYIIELQGITKAIEFCEKHQDPELWHDLIKNSLDKSESIVALLRSPDLNVEHALELIDRIPPGLEIEGLVPALVEMNQNYQSQIKLEHIRRDLMARDCFSLLDKQIRCQTQGIAVKEDQLCPHCNLPLMSDSISDNQSRSVIPETSARVAKQANPSNLSSLVVVFTCHHVFHEECCAETQTSDGKILNCRVCMLETGDD